MTDKVSTDAGSSPALDRLRELIQEMQKSNTHANSENGNRVVGSWLVEDWIVRLSKLFYEVRELVPVPPQPVKETVRKAYTDGMSEAWAIAKNSEAPNGVLRAIDARISEWASQEPEVDHRETIAALKAELANHSPSDFHRPSSTCPDGELHKLRCIRCEIPGISAVPPAPSGAPEKCEHPRLAYIATEALARCPDCLFTFSEVQAANDEDPGGVAAPAPSGAKDPVKEPQ